ncbi:hypothetical protein [Streptomyces sp. NPDC018045]|uniref:hypothetical protein n=1 Tax=Streptomyces sp. NPDC018045 TaxID=3365037 RepID=UPI00379BEA29
MSIENRLSPEGPKSAKELRHLLYGDHGQRLGRFQRSAYEQQLAALDPYYFTGHVQEDEYTHDVNAEQQARCGAGRADLQAATDADCPACLKARAAHDSGGGEQP